MERYFRLSTLVAAVIGILVTLFGIVMLASGNGHKQLPLWLTFTLLVVMGNFIVIGTIKLFGGF